MRIFSRPRNVTAGITQLTFQNRPLNTPEDRLNLRIIGALAKAQKRHQVQIHAFIFLSTHFHVLATFPDVKSMSGFMKDLTLKLSKEAGLIHNWKGRMYPNRFKHVELSQEPEIEIARLRYILRNSCKEGLVMSPLDWPGASSTEALLTGEPTEGIWIDRKGLTTARSQGKKVTEEDFTEVLTLELSPLPSLAHLSPQAYRQWMVEMVREVEKETLQMHRENETVPLGVEAILRQDPHALPTPRKKTPRPWCHAFSREARKAIYEALLWITAAYREASERYRAGEYDVAFPEGTFPPARPYVSPFGVLDSS